MKQLLSLLLCFVFLNGQTFAKHEFPGGTASLTGIYGGVMVPTSTTVSGVATDPSNSIGLFSFTMPSAGFGAGAMLVFANGTVYNGTITAMGNPSTGQITAVLQATYNFSLSVILSGTGGDTLSSIPVTATANGDMKVSLETGFGLPTIAGKATIGISTGQVDSATLNPIIVEQTEYAVTGVQQSSSTFFQTITPVTLP